MPCPHGFSGLLQGDVGWSFEHQQPVSVILGERLALTLIVNIAAVIFICL